MRDRSGHGVSQPSAVLGRAKWSFACGRVGHPLTEGSEGHTLGRSDLKKDMRSDHIHAL
jgi:hypothetical protein